MLLPQKCHGEEWSLDFVKLCKAAMNLKLAHVTALVSFKYDINHDILTDAQGWDNASWPMQWKDETVIGSSMFSQKRLRHHYNNWYNTTDTPKVGGSIYGQYVLILYYSIATPCVSKLKKCSLIQWSSAGRHIEDPSWYLFITRKKNGAQCQKKARGGPELQEKWGEDMRIPT